MCYSMFRTGGSSLKLPLLRTLLPDYLENLQFHLTFMLSLLFGNGNVMA